MSTNKNKIKFIYSSANQEHGNVIFLPKSCMCMHYTSSIGEVRGCLNVKTRPVRVSYQYDISTMFTFRDEILFCVYMKGQIMTANLMVSAILDWISKTTHAPHIPDFRESDFMPELTNSCTKFT